VSRVDGQLLSETFVELTDTMVADFDIIDFLHLLTDRSVQLLDVAAAGLLLADPRGEPRVIAASSEAAQQAKGKLAERFGLEMDRAFGILRHQARARNLRLAELAQSFVDGTEPLIGPAGRPPRRRPGDRTPRPGPKPEG